MKRIFLAVIGMVVFLMACQGTASAFLLVNGPSSLYTSSIGNYTAVAGADDEGAGNAGHLFSVTTAQNGSLVSESFDMIDLVDILTDGDVYSTSVLVFGVDVDEAGAPGTDTIDINTLTMVFHNTPLGTLTYNLGDESIRGLNYGPGNSAGEVLFQVNLGFDFVEYYTLYPDEQFDISAMVTDGSNGQDRFFLVSGFSENPPYNPVPEPGTLLLLGSGLGALACVRRKKQA